MAKIKFYFIATICGLLMMASCSKDTPKGPAVSDQETAELFARAVKISVKWLAPASETQTWSNKTVSGNESGSAVVNGSFTYNYDVNADRTDKTYNQVVIRFDNYCDDPYYPHLTGTVVIDGTCTTKYGWNTSYWGYWDIERADLQLAGKLSGPASIAIRFIRGGSDWGAMVESAEGTWSISN